LNAKIEESRLDLNSLLDRVIKMEQSAETFEKCSKSISDQLTNYFKEI